jgi:DDE superfamily endonuclease
MEDVLAVYTRPYDPRRPQICMDEVSKQLLRDVRAPWPSRPGRPAREDYEYERGGVVNCFLFCEPLAGRRWVDVTEHRTKEDWAHQIKDLVAVRYPEAERIVLVLDNLNTHTPGALYEVFPPGEAQRLADKLELHYTPKHGSWLNVRVHLPRSGKEQRWRCAPLEGRLAHRHEEVQQRPSLLPTGGYHRQ